VALGFQASGAGSDTLAPTIESFSLNASSFDPSQPGGAYVSASLQFSDNLAGFDYGSISFRSSSSGQTRSLYLSRSNLQGSSLAGTLYASQKLDAFTAAGSWSLDSIYLADKAGNSFNKSTYSSDWTTFLSSSGITQTSYQIAYGPNPAPGIGSDTLAPTIESFSLNASSFDPSQPGGAYLSASLQFSDNLAGFDYGSISFRSSSSGQTRSLYLSRSNLQGSSLAGTLYASQKLDPFTAAGSWSLDSIYLADKAGNSFNKSTYSSDWTTFLSSSGITQTSFQIAYGPNPAPGTESDSLAPSIQSFSLDSTSLDPSQPGGAFLSGRLSFRDNLSGFSNGSVGFRSDSGQSTTLYFDASDIISGTELGGVAFGSSQLNANAAAGTWRLTSISLQDKANNYLYKSTSNSDWTTFLSSSGITQTSFQIAYGPNPAPGTGPDSLSPSIQSFSLDSTSLDPSQLGGAFLSGRLSLGDNVSGFSNGSVGFRSDSGQSTTLYFDASDIISGTQLGGVAFASSQLNANAAAGIWRLTSISLQDKANNYLYKSTSNSDWTTFLSSSGITQTSFQIAYGPNPAPGTGPDSLSPSIQSFSLDSTSLDPSQLGGAFLSGRLSFRDNVSGFSNGSVGFRSDSGQSTTLYFDASDIISGTELSGVAFASSQLNANIAAGIWRLTSISLQDKANNYLYKSTSNSDWTTFLSSSGITQTSFDVVYGGVPTTPVISLAVSPASIAEDGIANLVYTFSRTGSTTSALTVNYTVGGTASLGSDYSGIVATPATKTVSFAAGAATAIVTVDPTADAEIEPDETVALTLAAGSGYSIGTTTAVVGTILNDDVPVITLAVAPTAGTAEDGTANLVYTFSRTGPTTSALTVNYNVVGIASIGNASLGTDYSGIPATSATKTVGFAAGAATAIVTVDPTADAEIEPDETVALTLAAGSGYSIGTTAAVVGTILNDDIAIENQGNTALVRGGDGQAYVEVGATTKPITLFGSPASTGSASSTWQMLAAETIGTTNKILWRYNPSGEVHVWDLDSSWNWTGTASGLVDTNSSASWGLESSFQLDLNRDLFVGAPFIPAIESQGNTALVRGGDGQAYVKVGATMKPITLFGSPASTGSASSTWQMLAAETIGTENKILWRYNPSGEVHVWDLDSSWNWTGTASGLVDTNSSASWGLESSFQLDLNRDLFVGAPFISIESQGNTSLVRRFINGGQPYVSVGSTFTPITVFGSPASSGNASSAWQMLAAETIGTENKILWRYNPSGQVHVWDLDSSWNWTGTASGLVDTNSSTSWGLESSFQLDLNGDSIIGTPFTPIESQGNTSLVRHPSTGQPYVSIGSTITPITVFGSPASSGNASSAWQMLAAETIGTENKILWRYNPTGQAHVWDLNSSWNWTGTASGLVDPNSSTSWGLESSFQLDLNGDSIIGAPLTPIESQGNTSLLRHNSTGQPYARAGSTITPITFMGSPASPGTASSTWQMLAAETMEIGNKILWRYNPTGQVHMWALDSNWAWTGADTGLVDPSSSSGAYLLARFGVATI
jgi:hypothetical protein